MNIGKSRFVRACLALLAAYAGIAFTTPVWACTLCTCSASTSGVSFGTYNPALPTDTSGTVLLTCTGLSLFGDAIVSANAGASGNATQRTMTQGTSLLNYNLYTDSSRTIIFGDGTGGTSTITVSLALLAISGSQSIPVYARAQANQWVKTGAYSDSIVVTVTY